MADGAVRLSRQSIFLQITSKEADERLPEHVFLELSLVVCRLIRRTLDTLDHGLAVAWRGLVLGLAGNERSNKLLVWDSDDFRSAPGLITTRFGHHLCEIVAQWLLY